MKVLIIYIIGIIVCWILLTIATKFLFNDDIYIKNDEFCSKLAILIIIASMVWPILMIFNITKFFIKLGVVNDADK